MMNSLARVVEAVGRLGKPTVLVLGIVLAIGLGIIDYATGFEISFALFYLIPVFLVAWCAGTAPGITVAVVSAVTWQVANVLAGEAFTSPFIPYWNSATRLSFFLVVTILVTKLKHALERERVLSRTDHLTGALNSRAFLETLDLELSRVRRRPRALSLAYLDVDNFKTVNDQQGHSRGDELLRVVGELMSRSLRRVDSLARLGGDEFAILLPETDRAGAETVFAKLEDGLTRAMALHGWPVTFSIGVVTCMDAPETADALIAAADSLMYRVKHGGKHGIRYAALARGGMREAPIA
jgi:diguanylate cyclase (GGDEF)-like protein